ncbi:RND family efflux transporter, MFP subunit [Rhizobiales bacterium GAS191]|nr:RND family efflux transporter, MFP subunit [Rhizobiales bacterium GAS113]SED98425.1 RND family efflux transporter, MFP subunit [Rhizobiales bacterium GAS191]
MLRSKSRLVGFSLAALFLAYGLPFAALAQTAAPPPPPVTVAKPIVKDVQEWDEFIGRFEAVDQVDIRSRVSGYLDKVQFVDGAIVKAGDLLFTIDQRPYQTALEQAQADLKSAQARLEFAQTDAERAESLRKTGNISEQIFDQRRQALLTTRADADRAQATLDRAKLDMEYTEIRAPLAGRISRRLISPGNLVNANDTLLTNIVATDPIYFYFDVDERSYLDYLAAGLNGTRVSKEVGDIFVALTNEREPAHKGRLDFLDNRIDQASGTIRGRGVFENGDLKLTPGLFGRVRILGAALHRGILLPEEAFATDQDRRIVYVVGADNKITAKTVRMGPHIDGYRVVRDGLSGDETVVVNGLMRVRPGVVVDPQMTNLPPTRERVGG